MMGPTQAPHPPSGVPRERPVGVTLLSIYLGITGVLYPISGVLFVVLSAVIANHAGQSSGLQFGFAIDIPIILMLSVIAFVQLALAWGLWSLDQRAYWGTIAFQALAIFCQALAIVVSLFLFSDYIPLLLSACGIPAVSILYLLLFPGVRHAFGVTFSVFSGARHLLPEWGKDAVFLMERSVQKIIEVCDQRIDDGARLFRAVFGKSPQPQLPEAPRMYAPGRVEAPQYHYDSIGMVVALTAVGFVVVFTLCGCVAFASGKDGPGMIVFFFMILVPILGGLLLLAKTVVADRKPSPQQILQRQQRFVEDEEQRRQEQASESVPEIPDMVQGPEEPLATLGAPVLGTLPWCCQGGFTIPAPELACHGVVIGGAGSGKTVSLLRLAYIAATVYGYRVHFVDAKGDRETAATFLALMHTAGKKVCMFPRQRYNGWQGDGNALLNKLMALESYSEPYYKATAKRVLNAVCKPQPPRSSTEFFQRLDGLDLTKLPGMAKGNMGGVQDRYHAFFDSVESQLDGQWSFETCDASYLLLDGTALKEEAASLGRFFVEDFAQYAAHRKAPGRDLLIIDEYSAIAEKGTDAANLFERLRTFGCPVIVSSQSYAGLGEEQDARKILGAANWKLLHQTADPELLIRMAGQQQNLQEMRNFGGDLDSRLHDSGRVQWQEDPALHPDYARRLKVGQALMIAHGRFAWIQVAPAPRIAERLVQQFLAWISNVKGVTPSVEEESTPKSQAGTASAPSVAKNQTRLQSGKPTSQGNAPSENDDFFA